MADVVLNIKAQIADLQKDMKKVQQGQKELAQQSTKTHKTMQTNMEKTSGVANQLKGAITGVFAVGTAVQLAKSVINVRVEFEKFEAMLKVALGSAEAANREFSKIQQFASDTPFSVRELTDSFVRLVNQGFKPTQKEMKSMGDLAAAMGKDFIQLTEAIIDAQVGEFERLKEFGIRASKQGDQVALTFKGITKEVEFNEEAIRNAIVGYGEMEGVAGTMGEISQTLGGQLSNLSDSLTILANKLGEMGSGEVSTGVSVLKSLTDIVTSLTELKIDVDTDTGVIGFLDKVSESLKTFFAISTAGAVSGSTFRKLFAGALEQLNTEIKDLVDNTEDLAEAEVKTDEVVEVEIETLTTLNNKIKKLNEEKRELAITDLAGITAKNVEIEKIKEQIKALEDLGKAEKDVKVAKVKSLEIEDLTISDTTELIPEEKYKTVFEEQQEAKEDFDAWFAQSEEKRLAADVARIEAAELQKKLLTQGTFEAITAGLDLIAAANKDNAKLQQAVSIAQAIINGALGITKTGAELGYPAAIPFQIALGLQTLAQIATIRSQKFERGGYDVLKGKRHAQGGVDIGIGEAEAGEGLAVFSRQATQKYGKFLPAFVKAINENDGEFGYSDGAYMISFDDSKSVSKLEEIKQVLSKPEIRYEKGYRIETRKGQTTRVKV